MTERTLFDDYPWRVSLSEMRALVERSKEPCFACGETSALQPHRMDASKVDTLGKIAQLMACGNEWARVERGSLMIGLATGDRRSTDYCAAEHAMRASWFGLTERSAPRQTNWRVTPLGFQFLHGQIEVPAKILCRKARTVYTSRETVRLSDVRGVKLDKAYWDAYPWSDFGVVG